LYCEISAIWQSDKVSRTKLMPQSEAKCGELVVERVLREAVPQFLRKIDATMKDSLGKGLPLDSAPIRFASWMGGDRDGNPNVTPDAGCNQRSVSHETLQGSRTVCQGH
jgi:phosphoenolpyruvate carboxylase